MEKIAEEFKPDIIIVGGSAYPLDFDYQRFRKAAGNKYLMADISHFSGLVATKQMRNAFEYADVVTTTTHKMLRGPRAAMIFSRKKKEIDGKIVHLGAKIDFALFPGLNGGPNNQKIASLALALKEANSVEYKEYCSQILKNANVLCEELKKGGCVVVASRTESHLFVFSYPGLTGNEIQDVCEAVDITLNKNTIPSDDKPFNPSGARVGTPAITTRGFKEEEIKMTANFMLQTLFIGKKIRESCEKKEFVAKVNDNLELKNLRIEVNKLMARYSIPVYPFDK